MSTFEEASSPEAMKPASGLFFLLFSTPDCGVCESLKHSLPLWSDQQGYVAQFLWLDLSRFPVATSLYNVLSVPTLIVSLDGQELARQVRHVNLSLLQEQIGRQLRLWSEQTD